VVAGAKRLLRSFGTATRELEVPRAWLAKHGVTYAGTERPGRKFDVKDAEWIAQLVRHSLVASSFVPPCDP